MAATVVVVLFLLLSFSVFAVSCNHSVLRLSKNNLARDQLLLMNAPTLLPSISVMLERASLNILRNPRKCTEREVPVIHTVVSTIDNECQSKKKRKYNRSRRRKPTLQCHGCKKHYKTKNWLLKHKSTCVTLKCLEFLAFLKFLPTELYPEIIQSNHRSANSLDVKIVLWNIEGAVKTLDSSCHDFSTHHIVALTETLSTTGVLSSDRTWINSVARKNSIGRPSGGLAIGLSDAVAWRENTCFLSNSIIAVDTVRFVFCVCYFQPKTAIIDIIDDFTRALSSISPCTKLLLVCGDFNCRLDSGSRGEDLVEAMFTCGLTCVSDRQAMTYIAPQESSCIDLVFVSRHHSHLVDVSVLAHLRRNINTFP